MKIFISILLFLGSVMVLTTVTQYLFCPVYSFPDIVPFSGDSIYNPYAAAPEMSWVKCNFHAHSHCWSGVTNGNATPDDIHRVYSSLNYGVSAVSNYQTIDTTGCREGNHISAYEHGCNVLKNHQLVLGARKVCWKDYYLSETLSNKQDVLNCLSAHDTSSLTIINHPMVRNGYSASDFRRLTNYSCMEVLNPACNSSAFWDAALSAGKPVFIVGDDDSHDVLNPEKTAKICTWVNVPDVNEKEVIHALRTGNSYAMTIGEPMKQQVRTGNRMPGLQRLSVTNNQIKAAFSQPAQTIEIIGINGRILASVHHSDSVAYTLTGDDFYARITADYGMGTKLYLNPVFRYQSSPLQQSAAGINTSRTLLQRIVGSLVLLFWFTLLLKILIPQRFENIFLSILNHRNYGYRSGNTFSKGFEIRHRWLLRYVHRFWDNLALQRKNRLE